MLLNTRVLPKVEVINVLGAGLLHPVQSLPLSELVPILTCSETFVLAVVP